VLYPFISDTQAYSEQGRSKFNKLQASLEGTERIRNHLTITTIILWPLSTGHCYSLRSFERSTIPTVLDRPGGGVVRLLNDEDMGGHLVMEGAFLATLGRRALPLSLFSGTVSI